MSFLKLFQNQSSLVRVFDNWCLYFLSLKPRHTNSLFASPQFITRVRRTVSVIDSVEGSKKSRRRDGLRSRGNSVPGYHPQTFSKSDE